MLGPKWQKRVQRKHAVKSRAAEVQTLQQVKRERFVQQEREWLLGWIAVGGAEWEKMTEDFRARRYNHLAEPERERKLEEHLVYWARRRVENLSQYGAGGWEGSGWERPESEVAIVNRGGVGVILPAGRSGPTVVPHKQFRAAVTKDVAAERAAQWMAVDAKAAELSRTYTALGAVDDISDEEEERIGQQILEVVTARWRI
jgi:hypothetical protein